MLLDPFKTILDFTALDAFTEEKLRMGLWDHMSPAGAKFASWPCYSALKLFREFASPLRHRVQ